MADSIDKFYDSLQTVPKLIRDLALGVAEAQRALDHDYLLNLTEFTKVVRSVLTPDSTAAIPPEEFLSLFRAMAPSRHQFTETVAEVRADLQMASASELNIGGSFGLKGAMFAVAVNASYMRRTAYDVQAAATIKSVIHAIPADPGVMEKLVARAASATPTPMPTDDRWRSIAEAFKGLFSQLPAAVALNEISPASVDKAKDAKLTLSGSGFAAGAKLAVSPSGKEFDTTFKSANSLEATIPAAEIPAAATLQLSVKIGATVSNQKSLEVK